MASDDPSDRIDEILDGLGDLIGDPLTEQVAELRRAIDAQAERWRRDIFSLEDRITALERLDDLEASIEDRITALENPPLR